MTQFVKPLVSTPTAAVSASGPVNGFGEPNRTGPYVQLTIDTRAAEQRIRISFGSAEILMAQLAGVLDTTDALERARGEGRAAYRAMILRVIETRILRCKAQGADTFALDELASDLRGIALLGEGCCYDGQ